MKNSEIKQFGVKINLQRFADNGEVADPEIDVDVDVDNSDNGTENNGDLEISKETSKEQSKDKDHPANKAFAELRRKAKETEKISQEYELTKKQVEEMNKAFTELAKKSGVDGIQSAQDYLNAIKRQSLQERYRDNQDPIALAELVADMVKQTSQTKEQPTQQAKDSEAPYDVEGELNEANTEFSLSLKSIDDVLTLPNAEKIIDFLERGMSISDAYYRANKDSIKKGEFEKAKQAAVNQQRGFTHIQANSQGGAVQQNALNQAEIDSHYPTWKSMFPEMKRNDLLAMMQKAKNDGDF